MKNIIVSLTLIFAAPWPLCAFDYGHLTSFEKNYRQTNATYMYYAFTGKTSPYLIHNMAAGKTPRVCYHLTRGLGLSEEDFISQIGYAFREWTLNLGDAIHKAGRAEEFKDFISASRIYPIIARADWEFIETQQEEYARKQIHSRDTRGSYCDLVLIYDPLYCGNLNLGSYYVETPAPTICLNVLGKENFSDDYKTSDDLLFKRDAINHSLQKKEYFESSIGSFMHEMGHAFGLGDQYKEGLWSADKAYSTKMPRPGIMACDSLTITCDDMDGAVSLFYRAKKRDKTFKSFCNDGLIIKNGKPLEEENAKAKEIIKEILKKEAARKLQKQSAPPIY
ncbi:MAG: hypothetical protein LBR90_03655 [Elusimicrobiota bacterium]|jgi:hypothetical protein|nr:hypothetical protein [Elusimicrobiota bacterium]